MTQEVAVETGQVSGKVFRFLSTMHPSLSKKERARYGEFQPESWYPWTEELSAEFADLMKRSPRDPAFSRGFAYVAQKGLPDGKYVSPGDLIGNLAHLPSAYKGDAGSGFTSELSGVREGTVSFDGLPGMNNACIAIVGELTQRLQTSGASGIEVKHVSPCRLQGAKECCFEVSWVSEATPSGQQPADLSEFLGAAKDSKDAPKVTVSEAVASTQPAAPAAPAASAREPAPTAVPVQSATVAVSPAPVVSTPVVPAASAAPASGLAGSDATAANSQDLFEQLRVRLLESEAQSSRHAELEAEIVRLSAELARVREESDKAVAAARSETETVRDELSGLKRGIRELVGDG
ncbi:MAG: hypothetical protein ACI8TX_002104 [Hyphomicrobiaceae bacterium]|jgi:hypothetical protein